MDGLLDYGQSSVTYRPSFNPRTDGAADDAFQEMLQQLDNQGPMPLYDYAGDDLSLHPVNSQTSTDLRRFSTSYEDPFADILYPPVEQQNEEPVTSDSPPVEHEDKLLSFTSPSYPVSSLNTSFCPASVILSAQLRGMFFLAESPWASMENAEQSTSSLTCYRRNLFQVTGEVTVPRTLHCVRTSGTVSTPIIGQELVISAIESNEDKAVQIIAVPWKTPANAPVSATDEASERNPVPIALNPNNVEDFGTGLAKFPFTWKRLQFRGATANNGRRKHLQQHFVIKLQVMATLANGSRVCICQVQSSPITVRGRSPRNFQSRNDIPVNGSGHLRKASHSVKRGSDNASRPADLPPSSPVSTTLFPATMTDRESVAESFQWKRPSQPPARHTTTTQRPGSHHGRAPARPRLGSVRSMTSETTLTDRAPSTPSAPIILTLVEEDDEPPPAPADRTAKRQTTRLPSFSLNTMNSPDESADLLYEYFPLGLDDWMAPVEAVYRPHAVHHIKVPSELKDPRSAGGGGKKRYFVEEVD